MSLKFKRVLIKLSGEALAGERGYGIDNETVKNYDFYRPENILIVDFNKIDEYQDQIKHFISVPYQKLPAEIFEKYSIKNWVKNIFRIGDYISYWKLFSVSISI